MTAIEPDAGTGEDAWARWLAATSCPPLDVAALAGKQLLVLAAHPDDEVLGIGGLLSLLASVGADVRFVWATDGEASHPGSTSPLVPRLAQVRREESAAALSELRQGSAPRVHLAFPDGRLADHEHELAKALDRLVGPDGVLLAPWSGDGHPDHEAAGRAARRVGRCVLEYPVWTWVWARPGDPRVPWHRARRIDLDAPARAAKAAATGCFRSQVAAIGAGSLDGPVLPDRVLAHFRRDVEVVLA